MPHSAERGVVLPNSSALKVRKGYVISELRTTITVLVSVAKLPETSVAEYPTV